ncbi:unnamed protein product [Pleuronectes platessa]|uniref:Uncharacterized protein n=1 Tax=Pleuronectes platessa TaxID=8262 RepID=A0A9N7YVU2_PLEPL|nr:unnamed protein product [Pleuronectes platessa]
MAGTGPPHLLLLTTTTTTTTTLPPLCLRAQWAIRSFSEDLSLAFAVYSSSPAQHLLLLLLTSSSSSSRCRPTDTPVLRTHFPSSLLCELLHRAVTQPES